ncbi:MAG: hypothetical protein JO054_14570 [Actinobacteria bacterium]|nr:hypothetical protein [Actinomycetota bacterium]MBV9255452.1 hypothetical protein [Actinomycetota bacterium]
MRWVRRGLFVIAAVIGVGMVGYAPIAIFGSPAEVWTGHGWLACHESSISLRDRTDIPRDPHHLDCRSQAIDQTLGAADSLLIGSLFLVVDFAALGARRAEEDLIDEDNEQRWRISRVARRLMVGMPTVLALGALAGSPFWGAPARRWFVLAGAVAFVMREISRRWVIEAGPHRIVMTNILRRSVAYKDVESVAAGRDGVVVYPIAGRALTGRAVQKSGWAIVRARRTRADHVATRLAKRVSDWRGGSYEDYLGTPLRFRSRQYKRTAVIFVVWLAAAILLRFI